MRVTRTNRPQVGAAILTICFLALCLIWLCLDRAPANWDDAWYLTNSLVMFDALVDEGLAGFVRRFYTILGGAKAPLITALPTPVYLLLGRDPRFALAVNLAALMVLFAAIYFIGSRLANGRTGLLAVGIAGTMPLLYGLPHWYLVEIPMTALVCVSIGLLIASDDLTKKWVVVALGISAGLGLLLKISSPLYLAPVFSYSLVRHAMRVRSRGKTLLTIGTFVVPLFAVAASWYLLNYRTAIGTAWRSAYSSTARAAWGTGDIFSLAAIRIYMQHVVQNGVSEFYAVLMVVVGLYLVVRRMVPMSLRANWICGLWLLPFFVFLFAANKDIRFLAPLLPGFALLLAAMLDVSFGGAQMRGSTLMLGALLIWPCIAMFQTSFGFPTPRRDLGYARLFNSVRWPHQDILNACVASLNLPPGQQATLLVGTDRDVFNANNFELAAIRSRLPVRVISSAYAANADVLMDSMRSATFVLFEEGGPQESQTFNRFRSTLISQVRTAGHFEEVYSRQLPGEGIARLFRRNTRERSVREGLDFEGRSITTGRVGNLKEFLADFGDEIRLEGLAMEAEAGSLRVSYGWRCLKPPAGEYWCFTHILDESGAVVAYLDHPVLAGDPATNLWRVGDVATEQLHLSDSVIQARAKYRLRLGLFQFSSGRRIPVSRTVVTRSWITTLVEGGTGVLAEATWPEATSGVATSGPQFSPQ